ncbi:CUB domain-containing protein 1 [Merluccius polli]|uniref:CUB domain-containing protein 1 n=1 Tax=Merluccius polli TaxID=89951 RepID=A0AA47MI31_MERPO|nr:CUB domain-containing protein 1 [Merluccius polli]
MFRRGPTCAFYARTQHIAYVSFPRDGQADPSSYHPDGPVSTVVPRPYLEELLGPRVHPTSGSSPPTVLAKDQERPNRGLQLTSTCGTNMVSSFSFSALLLAAAVLHASGIPVLNLSPERGTSYHIRNSEGRGSECLICTGTGQRQICKGSVLLRDSGSVAVEFRCPRPEDAIHVDIQRSIDCTTQSCNGEIVAKEPDPFGGFNRTFVWTLKAVEPKAFRIDFTKTGLTQIPPSQACPDHQTFALQAAGKVAVGTYCRTGPIGEAQVLNQGTFSLHVPAKEKLQAAHFSVSVGENIKSLARIKVVLPAAGSASPPVELLSPNYPESFPDDDVVEWEFEVPSKHSAAVRVVNHTQPACRKKETGVEYHGVGRQALVLGLADPQPAKTLQNFTLTLRNCEMVPTRGTPHGLTARFSVSAARAGGASVSCNVDLRQKQGLSLVLEKIRPGSGCEMRKGSAATGKITLKPNEVAQLSFLDCSEEDVRVTATRVIAQRLLQGARPPAGAGADPPVSRRP